MKRFGWYSCLFILESTDAQDGVMHDTCMDASAQPTDYTGIGHAPVRIRPRFAGGSIAIKASYNPCPVALETTGSMKVLMRIHPAVPALS